MMNLTEPSTSSGSSSTIAPNSVEREEVVRETKDVPAVVSSSAKDGNLSLTKLWEFAVRSKRIPADLDLNAFFSSVNRRLRDPEWVVRQHALRVLVDFIPLVDKDDLDTKLETVLNEIVRNLGHVGPAVRKAAVDTLKTYLHHSKKPNSILKELFSEGVEKALKNKINSNITLGIVIATPFLINSKVTNDIVRYIVHVLLDRIEQAVHQESILRSLLRIKGIVGAKKFDEILDSHKSRRTFEMLCDLYNLPEPSLNLNGVDIFCATDNKQFWNDHNQNLVNCGLKNGDFDNQGNLVEDKIILETEIKLNAGPAITMQIHEESRQNSNNEGSDSEDDTSTRGIRTFKVLTDSEDDYELIRRTPRRVRFGGEIVKMRTPDSDSNHQSDDDPTLSVDPQGKSPVIEIHYKKTTKVTRKSQIPIAIATRSKTSRSEPSSPKKNKASSKLYKSSPNLSGKNQDCAKTKLEGGSRIPKRNGDEKKKLTRSMKIKVNNIGEDLGEKKPNPSGIKREIPVSNQIGIKQEVKIEKDRKGKDEESEAKILAIEFQPEDKNKLKPAKNLTSRRNSKDFERYSPIPVHNEIEVFHNLTRSPERKPPVKKDPDPEINLVADRHLTTADDVLLGKTRTQEDRRIHTADVAEKNANKTTNNQLVFINNYNSFHVYNSGPGRHQRDTGDSPIPTRDTGECLTCSSSGSDVVIDRNGYEAIGGLSERILADIQSREDIRTKQRGLEELLRVLKDPTMLESVEERLSFLLQLLFSSEQQPFLQSISEQNLSYIFSNIRGEILVGKLHQIALHLSKTGSPTGVRLALLILKRIPAQQLIDHLLSDSILGAKSSKVREGCLQIVMSISRIFPSTALDIPRCVDAVVAVLKDRKRKVRQAALETLAALAQLSNTGIVLEVIAEITKDYPDKEQILTVVRTRLSRKQLPAIDVNGNVRYSTPSGETEIEWLSKGRNGTPTAGRGRSSATETRQDGTDATYIKIDDRQALPVENSSEEMLNYWRGKDRGESLRVVQETSATFSEDIDSDWSRDSKDESSAKANSTAQIWAIDSGVFATSETLSSMNATLRPVYVIQSTESQSTNVSSDSHSNKTHKQTNTEYDRRDDVRQHRGRSFSPPKRSRDSYVEQDRFVQTNETRQTHFYKNSRFHKSFSSDQLVPENRATQANSSSSGSSSTTSCSSLRSGVWNKDVRSGIPLPISSDSRFRFRSKYNDIVKGPMSTTQFYRSRKVVDSSRESSKKSTPVVSVAVIPYDNVSKLHTPEATPEKYSSPPRPVMARQPFSSGSESSGYFTPPAEPHLPEPNFERTGDRISSGQRSAAHSENSINSAMRFVRSGGTPSPLHHPENFTIIDSNYCESLKSKSAASSHRSAYAETRFDSTDYPESRDEPDYSKDTAEEKGDSLPNDGEEIIEESYLESEESIVRRGSLAASLEDLDFVANQTFGERKNLSKSETNIELSPDTQRKTVSSAPSLNKTNFREFEKLDDTPISSTKTSLPGSVVDFQEIEVVQELIEKTPDKTICKKTISRQLSRKRSCRMPRTEKSASQETPRPFAKPKEAFHETLAQLDNPEWEVTMKGLQNLMRLIKHHPNLIEQNIHAVCVGLGKHVRNLRSQVARSACLAVLELFRTCKKGLEADVEELATPLLHRTADTNKFLRSDANEALDEMCVQLSPPKVVNVIVSKGTNHQNAIVRCTAIRLLCSLCHRLGAEKVFQLPKDTRDKILVTGANMLMEGSLETRKHAKMMLGHLAGHCQFQRAMLEAVPSQVMRHISKTLKSLT